MSIRRLLRDTLRECDELYIVEEGAAILMPHTSLEDAKVAVQRFGDHCKKSLGLRFSIASYPSDATSASLLILAEERLAAAKLAEDGAVVCQG